jgi:4-hydroxy-tetrahydrodipicolinate synthase
LHRGWQRTHSGAPVASAAAGNVVEGDNASVELMHFMLAMEDRSDFRFLVGTESLALPAFMVGAKGCVSGLANAFPELVVKLWDLFQAGRYKSAAQVQMQVNRARQILHIPSSTDAACYAVLHKWGIDVGYPKAPILPVQYEKWLAMIAAFREMELL